MSSELRMSELPVALLAGGLATRLRPLTATIPKAMVMVAGRPFVEHQVELLRRAGVRSIVLCLGYLGQQVEEYLGDGSRFGLELRYAYDGERLLGTGGALKRAAPLLGEAFWVLYGDSYLPIDYAAVLHAFAHSDALGLMTVLHNGNRWDRSNAVFRDGQLLRYDKHNPSQDMHHIDYGAALLRQEALDLVPAEQPYDLAGLYQQLVERRQMIGYEVTTRFYEIGSHQGLAETEAYLSRLEA